MGKGPPFGLELVLGKIWVSRGPNGQFELQKAQIWLKRLLAKIWPKEAFSQGFLDANFNSQLASPNYPKLAPKGSWLGFGPEKLFPKVPRRKFQ